MFTDVYDAVWPRTNLVAWVVVRPGTAKRGCKIDKVVNKLKDLFESLWLNYINRNDNHNKYRK